MSLENINKNAPIKVQQGKEVRLRCGISAEVNPKSKTSAKDIISMENSEVTWLFKVISCDCKGNKKI